MKTTNNKQHNLPAVRREKEKKKELLCGWSQDKETLLQDDIGIETWFDDKCGFDDDIDIKADRRYKCALTQFLERNKCTAIERTKITYASKSATRRKQNRQAECCKSSKAEQEGPQKSLTPEPLRKTQPTLSSKSSASLTLVSDKSSDSSSSVDHVTLNQSTPADDTSCDTKWDFHSKDWAPQKLPHFSKWNDSPIVTLLRYEERLKNRRENRLNKRFGDIFGKVEKADTISPKTPVSMTHVCFTQGMIQPISKTTKKNLRHNPRATLPSLGKSNRNNAQNAKMTSKLTTEKINEPVKGVFAEGCRGRKTQAIPVMKNSSSKKDVSDTTLNISGNKSTTMIMNKRKFNFDVLENYALVRNARKDTNFTEYVKMIRRFQSLPVQKSYKHVSTEKGKGLDF